MYSTGQNSWNPNCLVAEVFPPNPKLLTYTETCLMDYIKGLLCVLNKLQDQTACQMTNIGLQLLDLAKFGVYWERLLLYGYSALGTLGALAQMQQRINIGWLRWLLHQPCALDSRWGYFPMGWSHNWCVGNLYPSPPQGRQKFMLVHPQCIKLQWQWNSCFGCRMCVGVGWMISMYSHFQTKIKRDEGETALLPSCGLESCLSVTSTITAKQLCFATALRLRFVTVLSFCWVLLG